MPQYRVPFFKQLTDKLAKDSIDLDIFYGETPPEWAERGDSSQVEIATELKTRFFKVGNRNLSYKTLSAVRRDRPYDLLILEQAVRNLETYRLMFDPKYAEKVAFWGHGHTYTMAKRSIEEKFKHSLTKKSSWFFGYTELGVKSLVDGGYPAGKTTIVQNSIDTKALRSDLDRVDSSARDYINQKFDLTAGNTGIYVGGIDSSKRIDFLIDAASRIHALCPSFRLLIVGKGTESEKVKIASLRQPSIIPIGPKFGIEKAELLASSDFMMIPGRVGLVAVDSLTAGVPIITTNWPYHAPEFEYLEDGFTAYVTQDTLDAFVAGVIKIIKNPQAHATISQNCLDESGQYTIDAMSDRFRRGIQQALLA